MGKTKFFSYLYKKPTMRHTTILIFLLMLLTGCSKSTARTDSNEKQHNVITELSKYNEALLQQKTKIGPGGKTALIATADIIGVSNGSSDGGSIGFWAGVALGNPALGKLVGSIVGGLFVGAAYSYLSYAALNGVCPSPEQLYNETFYAAIKSGYLQTINSKDYINDSLFIKKDNLTFSPEKESTFVGAAHNKILDNLTTRTKFLPSEYDLSSYDKYVKAVLTDSTFKSTFIDGIRNVFGDLDKFSIPGSLTLAKNKICSRKAPNLFFLSNFIRIFVAIFGYCI